MALAFSSETTALGPGKGGWRGLRGWLLLMTGMMVALTVVGTAFVHAAGSSTDYTVSSGIDPWGTTIDKSGNVWVAVPGCNPDPTCPTNTPPGKIEEFNPATSSWVQTI